MDPRMIGPVRLADVGPAGEHLPPSEVGLENSDALFLEQAFDHLADTEKAHGNRQKLDPVEQSGNAEGQARVAADDVVAYAAQQQPEEG